eukprot:4749970-Alexandrium_andersonii.AAC.1
MSDLVGSQGWLSQLRQFIHGHTWVKPSGGVLGCPWLLLLVLFETATGATVHGKDIMHVGALQAKAT